MPAPLDLNAIHVALKVAEHTSFVRASKELQMPLTTVSAKVQKLEQNLGINLFQRSTRRVSITEAGQVFFQHARANLRLVYG
jgi:LysR family transcriptional regulator, regulator for bpeEF and oprC